MGTRFNASALLAGMGTAVTASLEDNDLNININADHEGDAAPAEDAASDFDNSVPAETEAAEPVVEEAIAVDTSGTPETAELDVVEAGEEVGAVSEQISDVNDVAEGLEGIVIALATISQESIEVTPFIASTLRTQYDFVTRKFPKLRVDSTGADVVASVESWTVSQESETESIMNKTVAKLRAAGAAVVKFLKDLWEKIKALFGNISSATGIMRNKANSLKGREVSGKAITLPSTLTSAPFTAESIKALTGLVKGVAAAKINAGTIAENGWGGATILTSLKAHHKPGTYLGNFTVEVGDVPTMKSAEATKEKDVNLRGSEVSAIASAVVELADAIDDYKREEKLRKAVSDKLIAILQEEVKPDDASRYARWKKARETSTKWGKFAAFEGKLIKKAIAVGNAANNALAAGTKAAAK